MAMAVNALVDSLRQEIRNKHANLHHPFSRLLIAGQLPLESLQGWAQQRYRGITGMGMQNIAQLFVHAPDDRARRHIWELLGDEGGYAGTEPSHAQWLFRFAQAIGVDRATMETVEPLPETVAVLSFFLQRLHQGTFLEGLMAMVAVESQNPDGFQAWSDSLMTHYGLEPDVLRFFTGHVEADDTDSGHAGEGWDFVREWARDDVTQAQVCAAVRQSLDMYWLSLDGIYRAYVPASLRA